MAKASTWIPITTLVFMWFLISSASATTDASNVSALQDLYRTLSYPSQLTGWKSKDGDPCEEQWKGISCDGSSVIYITLNGLDLGGYLGEQLNLMNLKQLDLSSNHIQGEIPSLLPPNATNIDLSCNGFNMSIPYSLNSMMHLRHLNFSHNALSGPIGNVFTCPYNLKEMDLSLNNFTGDLRSCAEMVKPYMWVPIIITIVWLMTYSASATTDASEAEIERDKDCFPSAIEKPPTNSNVSIKVRCLSFLRAPELSVVLHAAAIINECMMVLTDNHLCRLSALFLAIVLALVAHASRVSFWRRLELCVSYYYLGCCFFTTYCMVAGLAVNKVLEHSAFIMLICGFGISWWHLYCKPKPVEKELLPRWRTDTNPHTHVE